MLIYNPNDKEQINELTERWGEVIKFYTGKEDKYSLLYLLESTLKHLINHISMNGYYATLNENGGIFRYKEQYTYNPQGIFCDVLRFNVDKCGSMFHALIIKLFVEKKIPKLFFVDHNNWNDYNHALNSYLDGEELYAENLNSSISAKYFIENLLIVLVKWMNDNSLRFEDFLNENVMLRFVNQFNIEKFMYTFDFLTMYNDFFKSNHRNQHIEIFPIKLYTRKSKRLFNGIIHSFLDIGSINIDSKYQKQGLFTTILYYLLEMYPDCNFFIESIINPNVYKVAKKFGFVLQNENDNLQSGYDMYLIR